MQDVGDGLKIVTTHAQRGARSVTRHSGLIADAAERAVQKWTNQLLEGHVPDDLAAWAFMVGANAAKRLRAARRRLTSTDAVPDLPAEGAFEGDADAPRREGCRRLLRAALSRRGENLARGRLLEVAQKMAKPGMTFHRAAKELGMDRANLRRTFRRALKCLEQV